jgi:hypothetical protein
VHTSHSQLFAAEHDGSYFDAQQKHYQPKGLSSYSGGVLQLCSKQVRGHGQGQLLLLLLLCTVQHAHHCLGTRCSILYQRGIYPTDSFRQEQHYGLSIMVSKDQGLTAYLQTVTQQMSSELVPCPLDS